MTHFSLNRRAFIGALGASALSLAAASRGIAAPGNMPGIGVQLYMLKNSLAADFEGTLDGVAALGVRNLEFAGFYERSVVEMKTILSARDLKATSAHCLMASTPDDKAKEVIDYCAALGMETVVAAVPNMKALTEGADWQEAMRRVTRDDLMYSAERFNRFGELAKAAGLTFAYHNHAFDFRDYDGERGLDSLLSQSDADLVKFQLDVGNTAMAGIDPMDYLAKHAARIPSIHMKDWKKAFTPSFYDMPEPTPAGSGILDLPKMVAALQRAGVAYMYIEQENMPRELEMVALAANAGNLMEVTAGA